MKTPVTFGHLILIAIVIFVIYYIWVVVGARGSGKPPVIYSDPDAPKAQGTKVL